MATLQQKRNTLYRRIRAWQEVQAAYLSPMHGGPLQASAVVAVDDDNDGSEDEDDAGSDAGASGAGYVDDEDEDWDDADDLNDAAGREFAGLNETFGVRGAERELGAGDAVAHAEDIKLGLPSQLLPNLRQHVAMRSLVDKERRLRLAQADDALADIRRIRRIIMGITQFRRLNINGTGQRDSGRIRQMYVRLQTKVKLSAERYRAAYKALSILDPDGLWSHRLRPLLPEDIRGPGQDEDTILDAALSEKEKKRRADRRGPRQGFYEVSWIWRVPGMADSSQASAPDSEEFIDGVRAEWAKAKARVDRWAEEIQLLQEEMGRVVRFLEWKAGWWVSQGSQRTDEVQLLSDSLRAYAEKKADILRQLARHFASMWLPLLVKEGIKPSWVDIIVDFSESSSDSAELVQSEVDSEMEWE